MSTSKHIDKICLVAAILSLVLCILFLNGEALGIQAAAREMGYESRLFDTSRVHTIDIIIDDWDAFLETARGEEYSVCSVVIDGEAVNNVGIRGKGNTSLSTVASMDSDRYSFKIEFDQYDSTKRYHGLDKLSLNNLIQDNTYMKDYLTYQMMNEFGVAAPLSSYAYLTVNGEDWGLYLAVEAVEESFLQRNYGSDYGELYKPDSMNMGGGRGNGMDFSMSDFMDRQQNTEKDSDGGEMSGQQGGRGNRSGMAMPGAAPDDGGNVPGGLYEPEAIPGGFGGGFPIDEEAIRNAFEESGLDTSVLDGIDFENITMEDIQSVFAGLDDESRQSVMQAMMGSVAMQMPSMGGGAPGGMGSGETKLQYIDDNPDSYSTIFDSAKTDITAADKNRLIASLKQLSAYEDLEEVLLMDDVLRYFVVHNFVVNGDSYTGSMIHNYYLYEEDGQLAMIPWDYNLAFGTFQGGSASSSVNDDIDDVLSDRPMQAWIFSDEAYSQQYYTLYAELMEQVDVQGIIDHAYKLIAPYVEKDPTAFCTYTEFQTGVQTLKEFCSLRSESVRLQLSGSTEAVDVGTLDLSDMGTMNMSGMGGPGGGMPARGRGGFSSDGVVTPGDGFDQSTIPSVPGGDAPVENGGGEVPATSIDITAFSAGRPGEESIPGDGRGFGQMDQMEHMQTPPDASAAPPDAVAPPDEAAAPSDGELSSFGGGVMPDNENAGNGRTQAGNSMMPADFPGMSEGGTPSSSSTEWLWIGVSVVILCIGLVIAKKYRH